MGKRVNIVLPDVTLRTIEALRTQLEHAAVRDRDLDREVAADWSELDREAWQQLDTGVAGSKKIGRRGVTSTSRRSTPR
jgi:hypothetical protein